MQNQAERNQPMYMKDWADRLTAFLQFNEREILENAGKVTAKVAEQLAVQEYEKYHRNRLEIKKGNDFDHFIKKHDLR